MLSDRIVVQITAAAGESFLDRMIALVEGAIRQRTPNEIALTLVLSAFTLIFLIVVVPLWPMAWNAEQYMMGYLGIAEPVKSLGTDVPTLDRAAGLPDSDDHRRLAGRHRHRGHGPRPAGQHHRQERQGRRDGRRHRYRAARQDRHDHDRQPEGDAVPAARTATPPELARLAALASVADETPEGKSIVKLAPGGRDGIRAGRASAPRGTEFIPFTAQTRMSGIDLPDGRTIRKGRTRRGAPVRASSGTAERAGRLEAVRSKDVASKGATPLVVAEGNQIAGVVVLEDISSRASRSASSGCARWACARVMITGDNPLTAAAIASQAGVDDFIAQATPEAKLAYIRKEQAEGKLVAMMGDGTNDAPALAQADVGVAMNSGTQAAKEAGNMVDLDSDPTKLIEVVEIGKQLLMTRGALTTFSIANDVAKYFAIIPALFAGTLPWLKAMDVMHLHSPTSAILSAVIFNAIIIPLLIPIALEGRQVPPGRRRRAVAEESADLGPGRRDRALHRHQADRPRAWSACTWLGLHERASKENKT